MSIPTTPATLASPPAGHDEDVLGSATAPAGGDGTFEGEYEGLADVTVADIKTKRTPNPFKGGELRDQLVWLFTIDGIEERGQLAIYTSFSLHEKSHLPGLIEKLGKPALHEGDAIKKSEYIGAKCRAFVEMVPAKKTGKKYPRITKLVKKGA